MSPVQLELRLHWRDPRAFLAAQPTFLCAHFRARVTVVACLEAQVREVRPGREVTADSFCCTRACLQGFEQLVRVGLARWERCEKCAGRGRRAQWKAGEMTKHLTLTTDPLRLQPKPRP